MSPRKSRIPFPKAALKPSRARPKAKPSKAKETPEAGLVVSLVERCMSVLRDLAFAPEGRPTSMYRTLAQIRLMEVETTRNRSEVIDLFLGQATRKVVTELVQSDEAAAASHLLDELGVLAHTDGLEFALDPESRQVLDELRTSLPPPPMEGNLRTP